ncbi:MAG: amidohydrolase family protein [Dehalococcoidia bacterium]
MVRVIDFECSPPSSAIKQWAPPPQPEAPRGSGLTWAGKEPQTVPGYGMANYERIFGNRRDRSDEGAPLQMTFEEFCADLEGSGVVKAFVASPNPVVINAVQARPDLFMGLVRVSPFDGMMAVREFERIIREHGLHGLMVNPMEERIPASDRRYYPLYTKAAELGLPVRLYSTMTYATDRPYDLGHPKHLDQICSDFPEIPFIAGLAGWPWINEMVALLRRHPNLYCDTAAHHPKYFAVKGSGWEMFMQFGNTLVQDKILAAMSPATLGERYGPMIEAYLDLPLKDSVKEKWLYGNAARLFGLE